MSGPVDQSVFDRNLVVTNPKAKDIIREHKAYNSNGTKTRNFNGTVLAYVTPVRICLIKNLFNEEFV